MSNYDNDSTDEMYDRYMLTGEGAESFEDTPEEEYIEEIVTEEVQNIKTSTKYWTTQYVI